MEWISVKDRLPERNVEILTYAIVREEYKNLVLGEIEPQYYVNKLYDDDNFLEDDFTRKITHWMPLPDPPIR